MAYTELNAPMRTIMTPGLVKVNPACFKGDEHTDIRAIRSCIHHYHEYEVMEMLRLVFQTKK